MPLDGADAHHHDAAEPEPEPEQLERRQRFAEQRRREHPGEHGLEVDQHRGQAGRQVLDRERLQEKKPTTLSSVISA